MQEFKYRIEGDTSQELADKILTIWAEEMLTDENLAEEFGLNLD